MAASASAWSVTARTWRPDARRSVNEDQVPSMVAEFRRAVERIWKLGPTGWLVSAHAAAPSLTTARSR